MAEQRRLSFAVFGRPRSGTSWAANWLTDGGALCLHDPIQDRAPATVEAMTMARPWGVSCSGLWGFEGIAERIAARVPVLLLDRHPLDSDAALARAGMSALPGWLHARFDALPGRRVAWRDLFNEPGARRIWDYLRPGEAFDVQRWREAVRLRVEPVLDDLQVCAGTVEAMRAEFQREG